MNSLAYSELATPYRHGTEQSRQIVDCGAMEVTWSTGYYAGVGESSFTYPALAVTGSHFDGDVPYKRLDKPHLVRKDAVSSTYSQLLYM